MLALTKKTDYALIALTHLARAGTGPTSARHIAERYAVPLPLLMNVLKRLGRQGMVRSVRGAKGGYRLAQRPDEITLAALIEAMEGPVGLVQCAVDHGPEGTTDCRVSESCPVRWPAQKIHAKLQGFLETVTLDDMIGEAVAVVTEETPEDSQDADSENLVAAYSHAQSDGLDG